MPMTTYLENKLLDGTVRGTTYTAAGNVYMSLYSTANSKDTAGTELSGNGYSRQKVTFNAASAGSITSNAAVTFTASGGNWAQAVSAAIMDNSTGGNMLYYYSINPKTVLDGQSMTFDSGNVTITIT